MIKAGVIGYPIEHSLSPVIHNFWLGKFNISGNYGKILVKPEDLGEKLKQLESEGYTGVNVTIPHKEAVIQHLDEISVEAELIGAVNTVSFENGKIIGENTDKFGFWFSLQSNGLQDCLEGGKAVILGAGGAARAVIANLGSKQEIVIVNRTYKKAEELAADFAQKLSNNKSEAKIKFASWPELDEVLRNTDLLVNTTSLGMKGQDELTVNLTNLPETTLVYDVVYNPLETDIIKLAKAQGNKTLGGLDMLIGQAIPAFKKWFGRNPGKINQQLRGELLRALQ